MISRANPIQKCVDLSLLKGRSDSAAMLYKIEIESVAYRSNLMLCSSEDTRKSCKSFIYGKHAMYIALLLTAAVLSLLVLPQRLAAESRILKNPYAGINWDRIVAYQANFHCHTIYSDGRAEPDELIYAYAKAGYSILAIADHDNNYTHRKGERDPGITHETTWPWTKWIKEKPEEIWQSKGMETAAFYKLPGSKGILAIRANELTSHPHIVSLFNDCGFSQRRKKPKARHDHERFGCIESKGGIAYWAHPAAYVPPHRWQKRFENSLDAALYYYGDFLARYDCLLGIEFNKADIKKRLPEAVIIFDSLLQKHYREHNIFLFGSDDNHRASIEDDAVVTIVLAEDLKADAVRNALQRGHTFVGQRSKNMPVVKSILVNETGQEIALNITGHDRVIWIKDGQPYGEGLRFKYSDIKDSIVRFQIISGDVNFYSQAFHIGSK